LPLNFAERYCELPYNLPTAASPLDDTLCFKFENVSTLNTKARFFEMQVPMCQTALQDSDMNQHKTFLLFTVTGNIKLTNGGMRALN
jgi:hypothetical protein